MYTPMDSTELCLAKTRQGAHPFCFVCSGANPLGLHLQFVPSRRGGVEAEFLGHPALEGYPGLLHGGVIASLLDGAMTNCLFAQNRRALTVELKVRYHAGVAATERLALRAWVEDCSHGIFQLGAEITQRGAVKARATGKFILDHE